MVDVALLFCGASGGPAYAELKRRRRHFWKRARVSEKHSQNLFYESLQIILEKTSQRNNKLTDNVTIPPVIMPL